MVPVADAGFDLLGVADVGSVSGLSVVQRAGNDPAIYKARAKDITGFCAR